VGLVVSSLDQGGLEEIVALLAGSLPAQGVVPLVLCTHSGGAVARRLSAEGVSVTLAHGNLDAMRAWRARVRPDVLSTHFIDPEFLEEAAGWGIPAVETLHNTYAWLDDAGWRRETRKLDLLTATVAVSPTVAAYHARWTGTGPTPHVIPNAVHPGRVAAVPRSFARTRLALPATAPVFVHLGRVTVQKNLVGLSAAFAALLEREPQARLVLQGPAREAAHLRTLRRAQPDLWRSGAIRLLPPSRFVGTVLSAADALVSNSFYEGWSVAASEALWSGLPVLLSECGGSRDLVGKDGERGHVIPNPVGDPLRVSKDLVRQPPAEAQARNRDAMTEAMVDLVTRREEWRAKTEDIRNHAREHLRPERMARDYAELFRSVVG